MSKDIPTSDPPTRIRGKYANHGDDPSLIGYLTTLYYLLSVPTFVIFAYGGYEVGLYSYQFIIPVFVLLHVVGLVVVFAAMSRQR